MDLMNIQNSPEVLQHHVNNACYNEAKDLETALKMLSPDKRKNIHKLCSFFLIQEILKMMR